VKEQSTGSETRSSTESGPDEDHSDRRIWWTIVGIGFVLFIGVVLLGRPLVEGRLTAARKLDRAAALIASTADGLTAIDRVVRSSSAGAAAASDSDVFGIITETRVSAREAAVLSESGFKWLTEDEQKRATLVKAAAIARVASLDAAAAVLSASEEGTAAASAKERAMQKYEQAIEDVRQADAALKNL
jgi:hypothetical protein